MKSKKNNKKLNSSPSKKSVSIKDRFIAEEENR